MYILFLTGRETSYSRNEVLLRAFRRFANVDVLGEFSTSSIITRSLSLSLKGLTRFRSRKYDLIFVGFYGHLLMLSAGLSARAPILFDAFLSTYDTLTFDRNLFSPRSLSGKLARWLDQTACRLASYILLDTPLHTAYFSESFGVPTEKMASLPVGCNEDLFYPHPLSSNSQTNILYYTTYLPLHGVETVVRAAALLQENPAFHFQLIGQGQTYFQIRQLAVSLQLNNITFSTPIPLNNLPKKIAAAQICLGGHFGTSEKAGRVVPGKIYQLLAMARPIIAADTPANQELLIHNESAYLIPPHDPAALAEALLVLHRNPALRNRLAQGGREVYETRCSEAVITTQLEAICNRLI